MPAKSPQTERFENLSYEGFRELAKDASLTAIEKVGFPTAYRAGKEGLIFDDILQKLPALNECSKTVLDIGPGCSELATLLIDHCRVQEHTLLLLDSEEMLAQLPEETPLMKKIPAFYPKCDAVFEAYTGRIDVMLTYSVFHYIFAEANVWEFLDKSLELLAHGGMMLIGDIPNQSKRKRFFSTPAGVAYHQAYTGTDTLPSVEFNTLEHGVIDDSVMMSLVLRARNQGVDAYILPQAPELPMANRREDILLVKP